LGEGLGFRARLGRTAAATPMPEPDSDGTRKTLTSRARLSAAVVYRFGLGRTNGPGRLRRLGRIGPPRPAS
jgi:hypothetical protein